MNKSEKIDRAILSVSPSPLKGMTMEVLQKISSTFDSFEEYQDEFLQIIMDRCMNELDVSYHTRENT